jgi:hypothetical protein
MDVVKLPAPVNPDPQLNESEFPENRTDATCVPVDVLNVIGRQAGVAAAVLRKDTLKYRSV